jgi:poly(hydroxyalkanoate) depolymerase family esterase
VLSKIRDKLRRLVNRTLAVFDPTRLASGGRFLSRTYVSPAGRRRYKLYLPSGYRAQLHPLLVLLHGCKQSAADFAAGTRMNEQAEINQCVVAYPEQSRSANPLKCWNWFNPADQRRDQGEAALIAGIARQIMREYRIDHTRVYVAGLSAGGAAAANVAMAYPDLFAGLGIHSGLPCRAAHDVQSAFRAMRDGRRRDPADTGNGGELLAPGLRTIVFHGDGDDTVNPRNGAYIVSEAKAAARTELRCSLEQGRVPEGRAYSRSTYRTDDGRVLIEEWTIHGAGHAWSGGSPLGSYTDPQGPDASAEMLRFFLSGAPISGVDRGTVGGGSQLPDA